MSRRRRRLWAERRARAAAAGDRPPPAEGAGAAPCIRVHLARVVLHDLAPVPERVFRDALRDALRAELLAAPDHDWGASRRVAGMRAGASELAPGAPAEAMGAAIARALAGGLLR